MARAIGRLFKGLGVTLLFLVVALCLAIVVIPPFLDRIYYRGPTSDHFDGERFFNPGRDDTFRIPGGGSRGGFILRRILGEEGQPVWPERVAVNQSKPAARVMGEAMVATWIGHATVLVQTNGLNILTDPIWSETAGPLGFGPRRVAEPGVRFEDLPKIDLVLVSHNHYDHMDLATLKRLWERDKPTIVTSLGNDAILRSRGIEARALDWNQSASFGWFTNEGPNGEQYRGPRPCCSVTVTRNHHWSSRWGTDRNRALWSSFVVKTRVGNIFHAGDTGFGDGEWPREAARLGPVRLAIVPIGAFRFEPGEMGTGSHIGPGQAVEVFRRLGARKGLGVHWGTFRLSREAYDTPPKMTALFARCAGLAADAFVTTRIGEAIVVPPYAPPGAGRGDPRPCREDSAAMRALE